MSDEPTPANDNTGVVEEEATLLSAETEEVKDESTEEVTEQTEENTEEKSEVKTEEKQAEPIEYELTTPENMPVNEDVLAEYKDIANELGLSQEGAQKLMDLAVKNAQNQYDQHHEVQKQWVDNIKSDKEFGGNNLQTTVKSARGVIDKYGDPEVLALLDTTGLGNNPGVIKMFARIGKKVAEDSLVDGSPGGSKKSLAETMYPNMKQQ